MKVRYGLDILFPITLLASDIIPSTNMETAMRTIGTWNETIGAIVEVETLGMGARGTTPRQNTLHTSTTPICTTEEAVVGRTAMKVSTTMRTLGIGIRSREVVQKVPMTPEVPENTPISRKGMGLMASIGVGTTALMVGVSLLLSSILRFILPKHFRLRPRSFQVC